MREEKTYLKSLKSESVVQRVINCLTDAMISGELKPGDQIPTEPELASSLGVARTSIREATKILTYLGVLECKRAEGTFVANGFSESMIDPMVYGVILNGDDGFEDLMELREMMEAGMMRLAMRKVDEEGISKLKEKLDEMERITRKGGDMLQEVFAADNEFHDMISSLCNNPLATKIDKVVRTLTYATRYETVAHMIHSGRVDELIEAHRKIYMMLKEGTAENIEERVRETYFLNARE